MKLVSYKLVSYKLVSYKLVSYKLVSYKGSLVPKLQVTLSLSYQHTRDATTGSTRA